MPQRQKDFMAFARQEEHFKKLFRNYQRKVAFFMTTTTMTPAHPSDELKLLIFIFSLSNLQKRLPLVPISTSFASIFVSLEHDVKCNLRLAKLLIAKLCVCGVGWLGAPNSGRLFTTSFSWAAKMHRKLSFYFISGEVETSNVAQNLIDFLNLRVRRKLLVNVQWC